MLGFKKLLGFGLVFLSWIFSIHAGAFQELLILDQRCTVSVLNRTVQANEQGRFVLNNVPSTLGRVRARATCEFEEGTVSGETDYFALVTNRISDVGDFYRASGELTPIELTITNAKPIKLTNIGESITLQVRALYADNSTKTVSDPRFGTNYVSSNRDVVTVDANGVVRAIASGRVLITVRKDGVVAIVVVNVAAAGDSDGDGIPDDIEVAAGLDPNDAIDALEDVDNDGLSNSDEYILGTAIDNADSDGDSISDGEEVIAGEDGYITLPLNRDTDNDGLSDGLEVELNSDPNDINDANYTDALTGISVTPNSALLYYNTVDTESSLQLNVIGQLIDGGSVDLTNTTFGTRYSSESLTVVNFGAQAGQVFAGVTGTSTITVTNGNFSAEALVRVVTFTPRVITYASLDSRANKVDFNGRLAFVATQAGMSIVDFTQPNRPFVIANLELSDNGVDIKQSGNFAYVATASGIDVVNVSTIGQPVLQATIALGAVNDLALQADRLYAVGSNTLTILQTQENGAPIIISQYTQANVRAVAVENDLVALVANGRVYAVDASDESNLLPLSNVAVDGARQVEISGARAFLAASNKGYYASIDFSEATAPVLKSSGREFFPQDLAISGDLVFFAETQFPSAVPIVNINNINAPRYQVLINQSRFGDDDCRGVDADNVYVLCAGGRRVYISQYRQAQDFAGIAPSVSIATPLVATSLSQGRPYRLIVDASDDVKVAAVNIYINDELLHTDVTQPYSTVLRVSEDATQLSIRAEAIDLAGNVGTTGNVLYNVEPFTAVVESFSNEVVDFFDDDLLTTQISFENATFISDFKLTSTGDLVVTGSQASNIQVQELIVEGNLIIDGSQLSITSGNVVTVLGDVILKNGATLTTDFADRDLQKIHRLAFNVEGNVELNQSSSINLTGKGYPFRQISGPDWSGSARYGCHGGARSANFNQGCIYGRFQKARFAGSGGYESGGNVARGGGALDIKATQLIINDSSTITANGEPGHASFGGGAGGGIHLAVDRLMGSGTISANGGVGGSHNAAGGRISIYLDDNQNYSGQVLTSNNTNAGAGTIFIKKTTDQYGQLIIDNRGAQSVNFGTPLPQVGKHIITDAQPIADNRWLISVENTPWQTTNTAFEFGIDALTVSLDASQQQAQLYTVESNTSNTLTIQSQADLSSIVGNTLQGVIQLDRLTLTNGAWLDVGEDRLRVLEDANITINNAGSISGDDLSENLIEKAIATGGGVVSKTAVRIVNLDVTGTGNIIIQAPTFEVEGDFSLSGLSVVFKLDEPLVVGGDFNMLAGSKVTSTALQANNLFISASTLTGEVIDVDGDITLRSNAVINSSFGSLSKANIYGLDIVAGGVIDIELGSLIDTNSRGYPSSYYSGPDFSQSRRSCHGGIQQETSSDCTYGRYQRAMFAGSAGHNANGSLGRGGGLVELQATELILDGRIRANGERGYDYGGAGGGVHLSVTTFSGMGSVQTVGGKSFTGNKKSAGAGGRISVHAQDFSGYAGSYLVYAGSTDPAGAGTVYRLDVDETYGHLLVDNNGYVARTGSTPIRNVGRHEILAVTQVQPSQWLVEVAGAPWRATDLALGWGLQDIEVDLDAGDSASGLYQIVENTAQGLIIETSDDLSLLVGNELLGVHTFETLTIKGRAAVTFGDDRVVVLDAANSNVESGAILDVGAFDASLIDLATVSSGSIRIASVTTLDDLSITGGVLQFTGGLMVNNKLIISIGANVIAANLLAHHLFISASTLTGELIDVTGDLTLLDGATVTTARLVRGLVITVGGIADIDSGSSIDVDFRGYPTLSTYTGYSGPDYGTTRMGCYGGITPEHAFDCTYGHYQQATFVGSAGDGKPSFEGRGGGLVSLSADTLILNGVIQANGGTGRIHGAAGGGVHLSVATLLGSGRLLANGGTRDRPRSRYVSASGSGGRISIHAGDNSQFVGTAQARSGAIDIAGAGTIYVLDTDETYGHLTVDNKGYAARTNSTPIRSVGRHEIIAATETAPGRWLIEVPNSPWKVTDATLEWGVQGIEVDLDADEDFSRLYTIIENTKQGLVITTDDDLSGLVGNVLVGVHTFATLNIKGRASVSFGNDRVVLLDAANSSIASGSSLTVGPYNPSLVAIAAHSQGTIRILDEVLVEDLVVTVGSLQFNKGLTVAGELNLSLGAKVVANNLSVAQVELSSATLTTTSLNLPGDISLSGSSVLIATVIDIGGQVSLSSSSRLSASSSIVCDGLSMSNTAKLSTRSLEVLTDLMLRDSATISTDSLVRGLDIAVAGIADIGSGSSINVDFRGYPNLSNGEGYSGPDYGTTRFGCYGGTTRKLTFDCTYGHYQQASFAGSGGDGKGSFEGRGGGRVSLYADALILNGVIRANGGEGRGLAGAGGGVHLSVTTLTGSGGITANGGTRNRPRSSGTASGSGGRISIHAADESLFDGALEARSGTIDIAGAGTIYVLDTDESYGHLTVDNRGHVALSNSTPIRSVGRHEIVAATETDPGIWLVEVPNSPWKVTNVDLEWGVQGIEVDLDADEGFSRLYMIIENTKQGLMIATNDDLSGLVGNVLVGVHTFTTLNIKGRASVNFGNDRVVVNDIANSIITGSINGVSADSQLP